MIEFGGESMRSMLLNCSWLAESQTVDVLCLYGLACCAALGMSVARSDKRVCALIIAVQ